MPDLSILFVDDEANVLQALKRLLRPMRHEWEMSFANSGEEALKCLSEKPFHVVVSDMRRPGMDGAELLIRVREQYPHIFRVVLSGYSEKEQVLRSVGIAHQFLSKPCNPTAFKDTIDRVNSVRNRLTQEGIKRVVSQIGSLPSLPTVYLQITEHLKEGNPSILRIGEIIERDIGMSAKVLQLANSSFFGLSRRVSNAAQATKLLGIDTVKALVLYVHVFSKITPAELSRFGLSNLWEYSAAVAAAAKQIAAQEDAPAETIDDAMIAGILHDAGKLILVQGFPKEYRAVIALARQRGIAAWEAEYELLGASHAEIGAYLLGMWGLPAPVAEAVAFHHRPVNAVATAFSPLTAVHVANELLLEIERGNMNHTSRLDRDYLDKIGLADQLPAWRNICENVIEKEKAHA